MAKQSSSRLSEMMKKIGLRRPDRPIGVIDIGSNSVRLVGYSGTARAPLPIYNERAFCRLGTSVARTGDISGAQYDHAMLTFRRFRAIANQLGIKELYIFATSAVRDASNRQSFVQEAQTILGHNIRVLDGEEEALLSANGVMLSVADVDGLVADLGGGSLELAHVKEGKVINWASLKIGVLALDELASSGAVSLNKVIVEQLKSVAWLSESAFDNIYAVGGAWRNLANVHMGDVNYGLDVLHEYEIALPRGEKFLKRMSKLKADETFNLAKSSNNRRDAIPIAANILFELCKLGQAKRVIVSATGVREGVLFEMLKSKHQNIDPLLLACEEMASRLSKSADYGHELISWTKDLFEDGERRKAFSRYRKAACLVSDISWSNHPSSRAEIASHSVLKAPFSAISHEGRMFIAYALAYRHEVNDIKRLFYGFPKFKEAQELGQILGLSFRLAHSLSASMPGMLKRSELVRSATKLTLNLGDTDPSLLAPIIEKRLSRLAKAMKLEPEIKQASVKKAIAD